MMKWTCRLLVLAVPCVIIALAATRAHAAITERVSVSSAGEQGNDFSTDPHISADKRYIAPSAIEEQRGTFFTCAEVVQGLTTSTLYEAGWDEADSGLRHGDAGGRDAGSVSQHASELGPLREAESGPESDERVPALPA